MFEFLRFQLRLQVLPTSERGTSYTASAFGELWSTPGQIGGNASNDPLEIEFDGDPVFAVGGDFFCTDFDGNLVSASTLVELDDGSNVILEHPDVFAGFVCDEPISTLTMTNENSDIWLGFDNMYVGDI